MRLFLALDIDDAVRDRIARFSEGVTGFAPDARWMKPESLHVTLKFIGEQPEAAIEPIKQALSNLQASSTEIKFRGYGFFPTAKSARVFWIGLEAGPHLTTLAAAIDDKMASLGIEKEARAFSPHLTLARAPGGSGSPRRSQADAPSRTFQHLQEKLAARPAPRVWYHDAPRVLFVPKPPIPERIEVHKAIAIRIKVASHSRWRHPERSRFSGVARDLPRVVTVAANHARYADLQTGQQSSTVNKACPAS